MPVTGDDDLTITTGGGGAGPFLDPTGGRASESGTEVPGAALHAGSLLAGRYRIVARLGGGGMGEVYRADDLTLGQSVALKFLPADAVARPGWLDRFRSEVRLTRQISHPNVCRVYDIGESQGQVFLSMEFVDGEDLSSVIRRIGRLPHEKAVQIARQICFGLAAAHEQGVVHRDLKPANIMLDGRGNARVMDFGVAGIAAELNASGAIASGTPAYMAPEQLEGREVSRRSDIYALGLVLYEVFTGRPAFRAQSLAELRALHVSDTRPAEPSTLVADLDPAVERVILRCLERDPGQRPASVMAVVAALPGGDPLAAAIAAGETPSPELVAASGEAGVLRPSIAIALMVAAVILLCVAVVARDRVSVLHYVPKENSAEVLAAKAREALRELGFPEPRGSVVAGFSVRTLLLSSIDQVDQSPARWEKLKDPALAPLTFWYRCSDRSLKSTSHFRMETTSNDPPDSVPGDTTLVTDLSGRVRAFSRVLPTIAPPDELQEIGSSTPAAPARGAPRSTKETLAAVMGIDAATLEEVEPARLHDVPTDHRRAYHALLPGGDPVPVRIEVGEARGSIVAIDTVYPWSELQNPSRWTAADEISDLGGAFLQIAILISGIFMARANIRAGRADRRGGWALALTGFLLTYASGLLVTDWSVNTLGTPFGQPLVRAVYLGVLWWVFYLAIEPAMRRLRPHAIIAWSRLIEGRWKDPLVGRDVLFGVLGGIVVSLLTEPASNLYARLASEPPPVPTGPSVLALSGARFTTGTAVRALSDGTATVLLIFVGLVALRALVKREWAVWIGVFLVLSVTSMVTVQRDMPGAWLIGPVWAAALTSIFMRLGLLAGAATLMTTFILIRVPLTFDFERWYAGSGAIILLILAGVAVLAARIASGRALRAAL
ncbi:MAG: Serine/threonine-protein kinase PknD [Phycisphaerales bacterium]|nr:Serine/threonine-protein kinase PknD [Phycisphaerales bacterium]